MITIASRVEALIEQWPMLKQGLELALLNTSAVARYLKPEIETTIGERVSEAAVLMALRRYEQKSHRHSAQSIQKPQDFLGDITVRSNLVDLNYTNSPTIKRAVAQLTQNFDSKHYLTSSRGLFQTSIIVHTEQLPFILHGLKDEYLEKMVKNLSGITLQLKQGHDSVPGILALPLQLLGWRGISIVECISTYDELNLILQNKDIEVAFTTLNAAINAESLA